MPVGSGECCLGGGHESHGIEVKLLCGHFKQSKVVC
jgi:hypothetical protein